jgi:lysophospholipase L1-like esterase
VNELEEIQGNAPYPRPPTDDDPGQRERKRFSGRARAYLALGTLLFILVASELFLQAFGDFTQEIKFGAGATTVDPEAVDAAYVSDDELLWRPRPRTRFRDIDYPLREIIANSQGIRDSAMIPELKAENEFRILFLGDSVTFGWRVRHDETFAKLTGVMLAERFPDLVIRGLNAGVPAYSAYQGWRYLIRDGFAFEPDLVVVTFGANDGSAWMDASDIQHHERHQSWVPGWPFEWSMLARAIMVTIHRAPPTPGPPGRPRLYPEEFGEVLENIRDATREKGVELLVVIQPWRQNVDGAVSVSSRDNYQERATRFGLTLRLGTDPAPSMIDGVAVLQELGTSHRPSEIFFDDVHLTPLGHIALAEAMVEKIAPWIETQSRFRH